MSQSLYHYSRDMIMFIILNKIFLKQSDIDTYVPNPVPFLFIYTEYNN